MTMWRIENHTPFGAGGTFARDRYGAETWLVAVRASYRINADGSLSIGEPATPLLSPEYFGRPGASGLKYDTDLPLTKPGTDIILHGHAYAPDGKPVTEMGVMLKAGPLQKMLKITGDRFWERSVWGTRLSAPRPFDKMPLTYENTYGGVEESVQGESTRPACSENPLGTGFALDKDKHNGAKAPNVAYVKKGKKKPASFAPLPSDWNPRAVFGGTYDQSWLAHKAPLPPDDFDERFYHCAPVDQQVPGYLKGGEPVAIFGMYPRGPLKFTLPAPELTFKTVLGRRTQIHKADLHTVILEPDIPGFSMVWHTALNCHNRDHMLEKTIIT